MNAVQSQEPATAPPESREVEGRLAAAGWGLFFGWLGVSFLVNVSFGIAMFGIAAITVAIQGARKAYGLPIERFWLVVGGLFALVAVWDAFDPRLPLIGVVLLLVGAAILSAVVRRS